MAILLFSGSPLQAGYLKICSRNIRLPEIQPAARQRFSGSLSHKQMLISITNHPRLATHPLKQRIKPCLQNPC